MIHSTSSIAATAQLMIMPKATQTEELSLGTSDSTAPASGWSLNPGGSSGRG